MAHFSSIFLCGQRSALGLRLLPRLLSPLIEPLSCKYERTALCSLRLDECFRHNGRAFRSNGHAYRHEESAKCKHPWPSFSWHAYPNVAADPAMY